MQLLLAHGADPDTRSHDEHAHTPLHLATQHQHLHVVDALLAGGADPDVRDGHGATASMYAEGLDNAELLARLARAGAGRGVMVDQLISSRHA